MATWCKSNLDLTLTKKEGNIRTVKSIMKRLIDLNANNLQKHVMDLVREEVVMLQEMFHNDAVAMTANHLYDLCRAIASTFEEKGTVLDLRVTQQLSVPHGIDEKDAINNWLNEMRICCINLLSDL